MTLAIVLIITACLALVCILGLTISRGLQISSGRNFASEIRPLDVEAFRNLLNRGDDDFLRQHLAGAELREVQRARLRAMAAYVLEAGRNAGILIRIGQAAMAAGDPQTTQAAQQMVDQALLVRRNVAIAIVKIYAAWTWPNSGVSMPHVFDGYEQLNRSAMLLGRLQNPTVPVRISARF